MKIEVAAAPQVPPRSVGKSVSRGHVKSNTTSGRDMLDLGTLDDAAVV